MDPPTLENYDTELVRCIQLLKQKRDQVQQQIVREEDDRNKLQREIRILSERLHHLNESITLKSQARVDYDKTIAETEAAYLKIRESAQTLVQVLKRESSMLDQKGSSLSDTSAPDKSGTSGSTASRQAYPYSSR